jgi:isoamylase
MNGRGVHTLGPRGEHIIDDTFYVIFNAYHDSLNYNLPPEKYGSQWTKILDTSKDFLDEDGKETFEAGQKILIEGRSVVLLKHPIFLDNEL